MAPGRRDDRSAGGPRNFLAASCPRFPLRPLFLQRWSGIKAGDRSRTRPFNAPRRAAVSEMSNVVVELLGQKTKLLSYIFRRDRNRSRSEDILQEVMLRVVEQSRKQEISNPLAYAYRVADSVIFTHAGKYAAEAEVLNEDLKCDRPLADEVLQHKEKVAIFQNALSNLTPLQREIFLRRHVDGRSRQEIAETLDMNLEAVKKHLVRAMAELARAIERAERGEPHDGREPSGRSANDR